MDEINIFVEDAISYIGVRGDMVQVLRHVLLGVIAIFLSWLSGWLCRKLLVPSILRISKKTVPLWTDVVFDRKLLDTACHVVPAIVVWQLLPMVFGGFPLVKEILSRITAIYIIVASVRLITGFINGLKKIDTRSNSAAKQYLQSFCGVLKIVVLFVAAIVVVAILLGKNPATLIAGLGATSAILMLVFKDTIEGLVAGVRLTSNEMVHAGEWITVPGTQVNGVVEEITLTTVKVRQFDNTTMTVSPLTLVNGSFQNWRSMQESGGRRAQRKIYLDFRSIRIADEDLLKRLAGRGLVQENDVKGNTTNVTLFRKYVENYLKANDKVNTEQTVMVRQIEATQSGLPLELYFFIKNREWIVYEHVLADIMEYVYAIVPEFGLKIYQQYPEQ